MQFLSLNYLPADFDLFRRYLKQIIPWMFILDHAHYSRWLSVFVHDLQRLEDTDKNILQNFMEGCFVVNESGKPFSCKAKDQAHKQNNKRIKGDGGAVEILDSEEALLKLAINGPVLAKILEKFTSAFACMCKMHLFHFSYRIWAKSTV